MRDQVKGDISPSYLRLVKLYSERYLIPFFGNQDIRDIHTRNIKDFSSWLPDILSQKSRKNILDCLHKFSRDMYELEYIDALPVFSKIKVPEPLFNWCDMETQEAILYEIPREHWPLLWFIAKQGVRPLEARALHRQNQGFER